MGSSPGGSDLPHRDILHHGDLPSSRRCWEGLDQAVGAGPRGPQYGCLFRKRENMVRAASGLSVGTMCPAP